MSTTHPNKKSTASSLQQVLKTLMIKHFTEGNTQSLDSVYHALFKQKKLKNNREDFALRIENQDEARNIPFGECLRIYHNDRRHLYWYWGPSKYDTIWYSSDSGRQLFKRLFESKENQIACLSFVVFTFRKMVEMGKIYEIPPLTFCNKTIKIGFDVNIEDILLAFFPEIEKPVDFFEAKDLKSIFDSTSGWHVRISSTRKARLIQKYDPEAKDDERTRTQKITLRRDYLTMLSSNIKDQLTQIPIGKYLIDKLSANQFSANSDMPHPSNLQIINFIKAITYIEFSDNSIKITIHQSLINATMTIVSKELRQLEEESKYYTEEDYRRCWFAIARECRNTPDHTTTFFAIKRRFSKVFRGYETETAMLEKIISDFIRKRIIEKTDDDTYIFNNKLFRIFSDGAGTAQYAADEGINTFILEQGVNKSSNTLNHLSLNFEDLTLFASAFIEFSNNREQIILHCLSEATDYSIDNRALQIAHIHILSNLLFENDKILPQKLRQSLFISLFGHNAYQLQQNIMQHLLERKDYKLILEEHKINSLTFEEAKQGEKTTIWQKNESLFFFYSTSTLLSNCNINNEVRTAYEKSLDLSQKAWAQAKIDENAAKDILQTIESFVQSKPYKQLTDFISDLPNIKSVPSDVSEFLLSLHTGEYLLYALADTQQNSAILIQNQNESLKNAVALAIYIDYIKKLLNKTYNSEDWHNGNKNNAKMYMTCGSARFFSSIVKYELDIRIPLELPDMKANYLRWLRSELMIAYNTNSLRYVLFMVRLLSYTNIDMSAVLNIIMNPNNENPTLYLGKELGKPENQIAIMRFRKCFSQTRFLTYDHFSSEYSEVCRQLRLDSLLQ